MSDDAGALLAKSFETLRLTAYDDARPYHVLQPRDAVRGVLTIGYGHTGPDVHIGLTWTDEQADTAFESDWQTARDKVTDLVKVALDDGQRAALEDFVFNVGCATLERSTLLRELNAGAYDEVPAQLFRFVYDSNRERNVGLLRRRVAEVKLWHGIDVTPVVPAAAPGDTTAALNAAELATENSGGSA